MYIDVHEHLAKKTFNKVSQKYHRTATKYKLYFIVKEDKLFIEKKLGGIFIPTTLHEIDEKSELTLQLLYTSNTEDRTIVNPDEFNYAGTDNDLVNMITSIPMYLPRMKFYPKLFNHYIALSNESNKDSTSLNLSNEESFLRLPSVTNTKASDVDVGYGCFRQRRYLERRKNHRNEGKEVLLIEDSMRETESTPITSIGMAIKNFRDKYEQRQRLRDFYSSAKIINQKRQVEIQQHRYRHHLCR
ncbi:hypothetical protein J3Q64DRAFT_1703643 [Phycomyces blakesleeanus]|uniref:PH domain-containing protein n=1 Tax=Phycomyces blakesleeanus TaxID=4837 RepID=A0ABR3AJT2_PHYBL